MDHIKHEIIKKHFKMSKNVLKECLILNLKSEGFLMESDQIQEYEKQKVLLKRKKAIDVPEDWPEIREEAFEWGKKD